MTAMHDGKPGDEKRSKPRSCGDEAHDANIEIEDTEPTTPGPQQRSPTPRSVSARRKDADSGSQGVPQSATDATTTSPTAGASRDVDAAERDVKGARPWQPRIVVFACNWCSYAGADTAGVSRIQQQPNFRMIRVMCSGRIQPAFVLRAFEKGADGVLVSGCHFGDCHYIFGNQRAVEQFDKTMRMVTLLGLEQDRLRLEWISAAEGARFAQVINEFTEQVRRLGPSPFARTDGVGTHVAESEEVA